TREPPRAPPSRRRGRRNSSTTTMPAVTASETSSSITSSSASIGLVLFQPGYQPLQFDNVFLRELPALAEVRHQRRHAAAEQPLQQALALLLHPGLPRQHRRVEVATAIAGGADRALVEQPVEQDLDGRLGPPGGR